MCSLCAVVLFLCFTGCWCDECNLTEPDFQSRSFHHVLHWNKVDIPHETVLYSVQYHIYGMPYNPVMWCQNISVPVCDLTSVMTAADVDVRYYAKITAAARCVGEIMFYPYERTILEAPKLSVSWNETSVNVRISPPTGPENRSIESITCRKACHHPMKFTVYLTKPKFAEGRVYESTTGSVLVWPVETNTEYCGDAVYSLTHPKAPRQSEKASFCVTVSGRNSWFHMVLLACLLALLLLIILPMMLCQQSVKRKPLLPRALMLLKNKSNILPFSPDTGDEISKVQVCSGFNENIPKLDLQSSVPQDRSKVTSVWNGYASQDSRDLQDVSDHCSSGEHSVNYSMIVGVQMPAEPLNDSEIHEINSQLSAPELVWAKDHHSVSTCDSSSKPLVLPVTPAANGRLQFNGLLFQHGSETESLSDGLTSLGERTPLLTDLMVEDLSCSSSYVPVDVSKISEGLYPDLSLVTSSYKQNWMPGMHQDRMMYILRTEHSTEAKEEEPEDMKDEESNIGLDFLNRWMLKLEG